MAITNTDILNAINSSRDQILAAIADLKAAATVGNLPVDGTAVMKLKQLYIENNTGPALVAHCIGGDGAGIDALGHHGIKGVSNVNTGSGMHLRGFDPGPGIAGGGDGFSVQGFGVGAGLAAHGGLHAAPGAVAGPGIYAAADAGVAAGLQCQGSETLPGILAVGGANGQGALYRGGVNGGAGARFEGQGANYAGYAAIGTGTSPGIKATIAP